MPTVADGGNVTISATDGQIVTVIVNGGAVKYENPVGTVVSEFGSDRALGPLDAGDIKLTSVSGAFYYEVGSPAPASLAVGVTASRDLASTDNGMVLKVNSASTVTLTVPSTLPKGFSCAVVQYGAGKVTLAAGAGVTLRSAGSLLSTSAQYATIGVIPVGAAEYAISGSTGS